MKVIDLLNKIAKGEEIPKKIRIKGWCYEFEWEEYLDNYYDKHAELDLMSALSMDKEELNKEIETIGENKKIEKVDFKTLNTQKEKNRIMKDTINKIIDKLEEMED